MNSCSILVLKRNASHVSHTIWLRNTYTEIELENASRHGGTWVFMSEGAAEPSLLRAEWIGRVSDAASKFHDELVQTDHGALPMPLPSSHL